MLIFMNEENVYYYGNYNGIKFIIHIIKLWMRIIRHEFEKPC